VRTHKTRALFVALAASLLIGASGASVTPPAVQVPTVRTAPRAIPLVRNPHLHSGSVSGTAKHAEHRLHRAAVGEAVVRRHVWRHRWNYHSWAVAHRGLGIVEGVVRDKRGRPVPGAVVVLKWPKGKTIQRIALRHMTQTNANGYFVMLGVRSQRYRVAAHKGKAWGRVQLAVQTGGVSKAVIKI
jgi:hypothetical protein